MKSRTNIVAIIEDAIRWDSATNNFDFPRLHEAIEQIALNEEFRRNLVKLKQKECKHVALNINQHAPECPDCGFQIPF